MHEGPELHNFILINTPLISIYVNNGISMPHRYNLGTVGLINVQYHDSGWCSMTHLVRGYLPCFDFSLSSLYISTLDLRGADSLAFSVMAVWLSRKYSVIINPPPSPMLWLFTIPLQIRVATAASTTDPFIKKIFLVGKNNKFSVTTS